MPWPWRLLRRPRVAPPTAAAAAATRNRALGRRGERAAVRHLRRRGYRILARNVRTPAGEVDLLASEAGRLVLVEVKTSARVGGPALARRLDRGQLRRLIGAGRWLCRRPGVGTGCFRVDLVTVAFDGRRRLVTIRRGVGNG